MMNCRYVQIPRPKCHSNAFLCQSFFQCKMSDLEGQLSTERTRRMSECEEWRQFQADLLMTVRVANDFQAEAQVGNLQQIKDGLIFPHQNNLEQISEQTQEQKDRIKQLENENDRLLTQVTSSKALDRERMVEGLALSPAQAAVKEVGLLGL